MKKIKKIISLFLLFMLGGLAQAEDSKEPEITTVKYSGELTSSSTIQISGKNLGECSLLEIEGKTVPFTKSGTTRIDYKYKDSKEVYKGNINLTCGDKVINKGIAFPYIKKIQVGEKDKRNIKILGENFYDTVNVRLEAGTFKLKNASLTEINGELPEDLSKLGLYVESKGNRSNKMDIPLDLIHIDYLKTDTNFGFGEKINICGQYFKADDEIYLDNKEFTNSRNLKNDCFEIELPRIEKKNVEVYLKNDDFISNKVKFNPIGYKPEITAATETYIVNSSGTKTYQLRIVGKNFGDEKSVLKANINGQKANISAVSDKEIFLTNYVADRKKNFVQIEAMGNYSNLYEFQSGREEFEIYSYEFGGLDDNKREVKISLTSTIKEDREEVRLDGQKLEIVSVFNNAIKVKIPSSKTTGYLSIYRRDEQVSNNFFYDARAKNNVYVNEIVFEEERKPNADFYLKGDYLHDVDISSGNLFDKDMQEYSPIKNSGTKISSILGRDYNPDANSSITLRKNGLSFSRSFNKDDIVNNRVSLPPAIYSVETETPGIKYGDKIKINGRGFKKDDVIKFGNIKTYAIKEESFNERTLYTKVPEGVTGQVNLTVERELNELKSNNLSIIVLSDLDDPNVSISLKNPSTVKKFKTFSLKEDLISEYAVLNKLEDLLIDKIIFKVEGYKDRSNIGSFKLNVSGKYYPAQILNSTGEIEFKNIILPKKTSEQSIKLYKNSAFIAAENFDISLEKIITKNIFQKDISEAIKIIKNSKKVEVMADLGTTCVDSKSDKSNCNKAFLQEEENKTKEEIKQEPKKEEDKKLENNDSKVDNQVDKKQELSVNEKGDIIMKAIEKIVDNKSKGNLSTKIIIYKSFEKELQKMYQKYKTKQPTGPLIKVVINKMKIKIMMLKKS